MNNRMMWLVVAVAFVAGVLVGLMIADTRTPPSVAGSSSSPATSPGDDPLGELEQVAREQPQNFIAWEQLAQSLFDANQPMPAAKAYGRALELRPDDADLLTNQGIMYRRLGWYDQAVGNFSRAADVDSNHIESLYQLGLVYRDDLGDGAKAVEAWERYLKRNPEGSASEQVRQQLHQMRRGFDTRLPH
ncbi:tetratricopeptide repeat protein [Desulfuromonas acetoxidans]|nr:tetratricopeptide repeat protein [Desulfuromonas acetoxidans]MBF0644395.1 tetratricopeptide repeat protein [Desulfuromonas acetoxidans]NVD23589.1 tetratricopeptide repeat protein [Desulfuromonas acetoxidans]NVE16026.1 tetratricopeptide repeat protein [Desulfuromonas acetoxidans]